jgi:DNA polymerase bacteriophage-type
MYLVGDFETASEAELSEVGLHNYAIHASTRALMFSYAFVHNLNDKPDVKRWEPRGGQVSMPIELCKALEDPAITFMAFNSPFERYIFKYVFEIEIPIDRIQDPQASARYLSLPANLKDVGTVLGLPHELRKDKRGEAVLDLFSYSKKRKKKEGGGTYFNTWETHPEDWKTLGEYCDQDVRAELEVARREALLGAFPLPERERRVWIFDQKVNDRGMPTDRKFVEHAFVMANRNKEEKKDQQNKLTGLENANSATQLMPWAQDRGYPLSNLRKQNIELVLKDKDVELTDECRVVLNARMEASSISYKKLQSILQNISPDSRLRNQFIFMGSARCGRWSGNAVQLHNMARPDTTFENMDNVTKARQLVYDDHYDELKITFKKDKIRPTEEPYYSPLIIMKNLIRTVFVAPEEKRFNVCDLNAIETRVAAWVAECGPLLKGFREIKDFDPYMDFANKMYGIPYEKLMADKKSKDQKVAIEAKRMRQIAKPGVLGAVYRLGGGGWGHDKNGDKIKTGLWGYAEAMGVDMDQSQAHEVVKIFRTAYPEIGGAPNLGIGFKGGIWYILENAVTDVLKGERTVRKVGPDGCIVIDKVTIEGRDPMLRIKLPSGRFLHYLDASIQSVRMPWTQKKSMPVEFNEQGEGTKYEEQDVEVHKPGFTYYGKDQHTDQWTLLVSHGGKIFENIVQGIARDVLAEGMLRVDNFGMDICGHVHDEIIALTDDDPFIPGALEMQKLMSSPMSWAPNLPLGAEGWEDVFYHK